MISVTIPVGPMPHHKEWLDECINSVYQQRVLPEEILIIDDMAGLTMADIPQGDAPVRIWYAPWRLGIPAAFNMGIALAKSPLVITLGADDLLETWAIEDCQKSWDKHKDPLGYYHMDIRYSDGRTQSLAAAAAMVPKALWRHCGGFPPENVGASDAALISVFLAHKDAGHLIRVESQSPPYWHRIHGKQDTAERGPWHGVIGPVRGILTSLWTKPRWGRYES